MSNTIKCTRCSSERIVKLQAIAKSSCHLDFQNLKKEYSGYNPEDVGVNDSIDGDSVAFSYCLECGQIQGTFPLPLCKLETTQSPPINGSYYTDEDESAWEEELINAKEN